MGSFFLNNLNQFDFFLFVGDDGTLGKRNDLGKFTASLRSGSRFTGRHPLSSSALWPNRTPQPARFVTDGDLHLQLWRPGRPGSRGLGAASGLGERRHMLRDSQRGPSLVLRQVHSCDDVDPWVAAQPCDLMAPSRPHLSALLRWR